MKKEVKGIIRIPFPFSQQHIANASIEHDPVGVALAKWRLLPVRGPQRFSNMVSAIPVLALLSFVPERVWKRYA